MSINACSINAHTINSLRCRRNIIAATPVSKAHPYQTRQDPREWEDYDVSGMEGANIKITLTFNGEVIEQTYENIQNDFIPMVAINSININSIENIPDVKISNFTIDVK
jgi:hypothetical protein